MMNIAKVDINVDGFRLIGSLHTIARQLFICSEIVRKLGNKQLPKEMLSQLMIRWSITEELKNELYRISKGKLTEKEKETTAFKYYLDLCGSLNLVTHFNKFYTGSRLSHILLHFLNERSANNIQLAEKLFYLFQLMFLDADGVLYILQQLDEMPKSQADLQKQFKSRFNERLLSKQEIANPIVKNQISEKYRLINFVWKRPDKYAEHLLIPRCEWLASLDILKITNKGNYTFYSLTEKGRLFFKRVPMISDSGIRDVNEDWLLKELFTSFSVLFGGLNLKFFKNMDNEEKRQELGAALEKSLKIVKTSNAFRQPLFDTLLFTCIDLFCNRNIIINISDIFVLLEGSLTYGSRTYNIKHEGRINESYVITSLVQ